MNRESFSQLVAEAIEALPADFRENMHNVEVVVEDWPDRETLRLAGVHSRAGLLGFYHGVPLTKRTQGYNMVTPDKISIYRRPILMQSRTPKEVRDRVHHVVRHEVAHYFGIDDSRLREIGAY
jgi:predicted Zn-dependent protease with MMP-like domain